MNDKVGIKNTATFEVINFRKYIDKLRELLDKIPAEHIRNSTNSQNYDIRPNLAIELAAFGVWDWDIRSNKICFSPLWKEMLGYPNSETGDNFEEWFEHIHPSDLKSVLTLLTGHLKGETTSFSSEYRILGCRADFPP